MWKRIKKNHWVLVLSWGGVRGFYGLGVLKALEEKGFKEKIDNIYGVSIGGILAAYWSYGYNADQILDFFLKSGFFSFSKNISLVPRKSLLKNTLIKKQIIKNLPKTFEELDRNVHILCTDIKKGESVRFSKGDLISPLLGSIAIPWIFPVIEHPPYTLIDGGATNNFPVDLAKERHPHHKILAISHNKYKQNQNIKNILQNIMVAYEIIMRKDIMQKGELADIFLCRALNVNILEFNEKKLIQLFHLGYQDGLEKMKEAWF